MIALELWPVLMLGDWQQSEALVLTWVLGRSFGPEKKVWLKLTPSEMALVVNCDPSNIRRAIRQLTDRKVLMKNEDGLYRFNKQFHLWTPEVNKTAAKVAKTALQLFLNWPTHKQAPRASTARNGFTQPGPGQPETGHASPKRAGTDGLAQPAPQRPPLEPPIEEPRASEDLRLKKDKEYPPNPPKGGGVGVIPFSRRDRTRRLTPYERQQAKLDEGVAQLQAEFEAMSPEDLAEERRVWLEAIYRREGQAGVDRVVAQETRDRERKAVNHGRQ